jgi:ribosomal protein S4
MRKSHKYKIHNKIDLISKFPLRVLRFKRPKWQYLKDIFLQRSNLGKELIDITAIKNDFKVWDKVNRAYKERLRSYSHLSASLDNSLNVRKLKQESSIKIRKNLYSKLYFQNYYKACTLVWLANFFASSFEARQKITEKVVFVNNKVATTNSFLTKGDIISILDSKLKIEKVIKKYNLNYSILTHVEVDYYSQEMALVKDISDLSEEDYYLLCLDYVNIQSLR